MLTDIEHPFAAGEPVYDVTFENVQAGAAHRLSRSGSPTSNRGIVLGTGDLSELGARLVHLWRRRSDVALQRQCVSVPKTLIQHLIRWSSPTSGEFDEETVDVLLRRFSRPRFRPSWCPAGDDEAGPDAPRTSSARMRCRTSTCSTRRASASGPPRSPISRMARLERCRSAARWPPNIPGGKAARLRSRRRSSSWLRRLPVRASSRSSQFKRSAMPNGPKVSLGRLAVAARRLARAERFRLPRRGSRIWSACRSGLGEAR